MNGTVFMVFIVPFLVGALLGAVLWRWKRSYLLSAVFAAVSVFAWFRTSYLAEHGVDGTVMLAAWMATEFTVGFALVGGIAWLARKCRR